MIPRKSLSTSHFYKIYKNRHCYIVSVPTLHLFLSQPTLTFLCTNRRFHFLVFIMFSIKKLYLLVAFHQTASGMTPDAGVSRFRTESLASLAKLSRTESGDMWLTKQADLIIGAIEQNTLNLTPEQRISCIQAMHEMIRSFLVTAGDRPDSHMHRMATILQAARRDRDTHPAQFSHELLITNIALRFLNDIGVDILDDFPGLIPDPQRQATIRRIVRVMQAMGYTFNYESRIGFCADTAELFFGIVTKSTPELTAFADHLEVSFKGMNALTLQSGLTVKWSYGPMALTTFYCIPALSDVPFETRLVNMERLSGFVGDQVADTMSQLAATLLSDAHMAEYSAQLRKIRYDLPSLVALGAMNGPGSLHSAALATLARFVQIRMREHSVLDATGFSLPGSSQERMEDLVHAVQSNQDIEQSIAIAESLIADANHGDGLALINANPAPFIPANVAQIPATSAVLVRIRNSLALWSIAPSSRMQTWLPNITAEVLLENELSPSQLSWLDNYLDPMTLTREYWVETACQFRRFLNVGIFDHEDIPIRDEALRERLVPLAKKLCSNLLYSMGDLERDDELLRLVIKQFRSADNLAAVPDEIFEYMHAYKEFQADPNFAAGNAAVGFVPHELLNAYGNMRTEGRGFREFIKYKSGLYVNRALRGSKLPLVIRAKVASHGRPWKEFEPLIQRFDRVYRTHGTKILMNLRYFEVSHALYSNLNVDSSLVLGIAHRVFARAFASLTVLGFLGDDVPASAMPLKDAVLEFLGAYVAFVEKVSQIPDGELDAYLKQRIQEAISAIRQLDKTIYYLADEGHTAARARNFEDVIAQVTERSRQLVDDIIPSIAIYVPTVAMA